MQILSVDLSHQLAGTPSILDQENCLTNSCSRRGFSRNLAKCASVNINYFIKFPVVICKQLKEREQLNDYNNSDIDQDP